MENWIHPFRTTQDPLLVQLRSHVVAASTGGGLSGNAFGQRDLRENWGNLPTL